MGRFPGVYAVRPHHDVPTELEVMPLQPLNTNDDLADLKLDGRTRLLTLEPPTSPKVNNKLRPVGRIRKCPL